MLTINFPIITNDPDKFSMNRNWSQFEIPYPTQEFGIQTNLLFKSGKAYSLVQVARLLEEKVDAQKVALNLELQEN